MPQTKEIPKSDLMILKTNLLEATSKKIVDEKGKDYAFQEFKRIIFSFLHTMPRGHIKIDTLFGTNQPVYREKFVGVVKTYIEGFNYLLMPGAVEFNEDYTIVTKR